MVNPRNSIAIIGNIVASMFPVQKNCPIFAERKSPDGGLGKRIV